MLCRLSLVVVSRGFSCGRAQVLGVSASVVVAHGPGCSMACGMFPDQGLNLCPLHWQVNSYPLYYQCVCALSRVRLCDPMDCNLPGSSVHAVFQARILEWVAISFSRGSSQPRNQTRLLCVLHGRWILCPLSYWEGLLPLKKKQLFI